MPGSTACERIKNPTHAPSHSPAPSAAPSKVSVVLTISSPTALGEYVGVLKTRIAFAMGVPESAIRDLAITTTPPEALRSSTRRRLSTLYYVVFTVSSTAAAGADANTGGSAGLATTASSALGSASFQADLSGVLGFPVAVQAVAAVPVTAAPTSEPTGRPMNKPVASGGSAGGASAASSTFVFIGAGVIASFKSSTHTQVI